MTFVAQNVAQESSCLQCVRRFGAQDPTSRIEQFTLQRFSFGIAAFCTDCCSKVGQRIERVRVFGADNPALNLEHFLKLLLAVCISALPPEETSQVAHRI